MANVLVTGGAGYIGSHTVRALSAQDHQITVLDDLEFGHRQALLDERIDFVQGKVGDMALLQELFERKRFDAVLHFAAWAQVGESMVNPLKYYRNNTADALVLLEVMQQYQCQVFVFSSTCATYGNPQFVPMTEEHPQQPINPYGWSKLMVEQMLADCAQAWDLKFAALRYFNACGAAEDALLGEDHTPETHLIPLALMAAAGLRPPLSVFGDDYPTADGTCVRDYIHVEDLAEAHVAALLHLLDSAAPVELRLNLGTGKGVSVREILDEVEKVTGTPVPYEIAPRREGDPPKLVGDPSKAEALLAWKAKHDFRYAIKSAWNWMNGPRRGKFQADEV